MCFLLSINFVPGIADGAVGTSVVIKKIIEFKTSGLQ